MCISPVEKREMRYTLNMELDFEIDKITESIENTKTGESHNTLVLPVTKADLEVLTKENGGFLTGNRSFPNLNIKYINSL